MRGKGTTGEAEKKVTRCDLSPVIGELRRDGERGDMVEREGLSCPDGGVKGRKAGNTKHPPQHILFPSVEKRGETGHKGERDKSSSVDYPGA